MSQKPKHISASQLGAYLFCPLSFKYNYIDKIGMDPGNPYTAYGSAIHEAFAFNFEQKITSRKDRDPREVAEFFHESLKKQWLEFEQKSGGKVFVKKGLYSELDLVGENVVYAYMQEVAPTLQPIAVELPFELELKHFPITIKGFIDLVTEDGGIHDYKTVGKTTIGKWTQATVDDSLQLTFYSAAYRKMYNKPESYLRIQVIPREHKPKFKHITTARSNDQVLNLLKMATTVEQIIKAGVWIPNLASCSQCPFKDICPKQPIFENKQ